MTRPRPRHALLTRLWHWANALALVVLFMSGLNISNAHRYLYWGDYGSAPDQAWLAIMRFPAWVTIPQRYDLAEARDWHNTFAWVFALSLLAMWIGSLINRHFWRDLATRWSDWTPRAIIASIRAHQTGDTHRYNPVQRVLYGVVLGVLLPLMIVTGLAISPGFEPAAPWLIDVLGGRQSARSIHFLTAWALFAFVALHLVMVVVSGPRHALEMITGGKRRQENDVER